MTETRVVWIIDTSSIAEIRRTQNVNKQAVFKRLKELVEDGRLSYPKQVVKELERWTDPLHPDAQYSWARDNAGVATQRQPTLDEVRGVLAMVPQILDPNKDAGVEEADPYVLAMAKALKAGHSDVRVVTEEKHDLPLKMSMNTAAGLLAIPSVPLRGFLHAEGILGFSPNAP